MQLCKLYSYEPVRQFVLNIKEESGVKLACVCERAIVRAQYKNLTKKEFDQVKGYAEDADKFDFNHKNNLIVKREKIYKVATVCYTSEKVILDIHYILNRGENGYRDSGQVKELAWKVLEDSGYTKGLIIGGYERKKKRTGRKTSSTRRTTKVYTKVE